MASTIVLQSSDNRKFKVDIEVAKMSTTIKDLLDNLGDPEEGEDEVIPVPNVTGDILEKVLEWAEYHNKLEKDNNGSSSEGKGAHNDHDDSNGENNEMSKWNKKFFKIENQVLYAITRAANFMDMKGLLDVCCEAVANLIKGKTPREIRELFGLPWPTLKKNENGKAQTNCEKETKNQ